DQLVHQDRVEVDTPLDQHVAAGALDVLGQGTRLSAGLRVPVDGQLAGGLAVRAEHGLTDRHGDRPVRAAVLLADDDVLRDVHQTAGQVTGVGGTQRRVRQTLTGTVRGDEVLQYGQTLP